METEKYEEAVRDYETVSKLDKTSREYRYVPVAIKCRGEAVN
jgi:hypothetical protein